MGGTSVNYSQNEVIRKWEKHLFCESQFLAPSAGTSRIRMWQKILLMGKNRKIPRSAIGIVLFSILHRIPSQERKIWPNFRTEVHSSPAWTLAVASGLVCIV